MPGARHHRDHGRGYDTSGHDAPPRSRGRAERPRALHRSSSYDERYHRRRPRDSRRYDDGYSDHDSYSDDDVASPPPRSRRRQTKSVGGRPHRGRDRRDRSYSRSPSRHRDDGEFDKRRRDQAIKSALTAGAVEAMRQRNRSGEWMGEKGIRVATAAMSAAAIDTAVDRDPRKKAKRNVIGSTLGGLFVDKLATGIRGRR